MVIVNGDDFGLTLSINKSIYNCIKKGVMNSASIMTSRNNDAFYDAISMIASLNNDATFGLHLDLDHYFTFDETGHYGIHEKDIILNYKEVFSNNYELIVQDIIGQIKILENNSIKINHINGHHNIHLFPEILEIVTTQMNECSIKYLRFHKDFYTDKESYQKASDLINNSSIVTPDHFYDLGYIMHSNVSIEDLKNNRIEIMAHTDIKDNSYGKVDQYNYLLNTNLF